MKKSILLFLLFSVAKSHAQSSNGFLDKIYYVISNETKDTLQLKEDMVRKNAISLQLMGDTPYVGMRYSRRVWETNDRKRQLELGVGLAFTPHFFISEAQDFSFSHHTTLLFRRDKLVSPFLTYSGVFYSGEFYKDKIFNYQPAPALGFRFGRIDKVNVNLFWQGYFYHDYRHDLVGEDRLQVYKQTKLLGAFGMNLNLPF